MYKVITSFWTKSPSSPTSIKNPLSSDTFVDEDGWVLVSDSNGKNNLMTNSWIASPPLIKTDESLTNVHHLNPIENLLIEHASMSVYEQIASKTRNRRQNKAINNEQVEEVEEDEDDEKNHQSTYSASIHQHNLNSSTTTLDSSTSSLVAHHRHIYRLHQRRKRTKLNLINSTDEPKQILTKNLERQRFNQSRTPKIPFQQSLKH